MAIDSLVVADITSGTVDGDAVFDVMMQAVKGHIQQEYTANRIRGGEYSEVYLSALNGAMDRTIEFLLNKDRVPLEAELLRLQGVNLEIEGRKAEAELLLINAQVSKVASEEALLAEEIVKAQADTLRIEAQTRLLEEQVQNADKERDVMDAQICKLKGEFDVLQQTVFKVAAETGILNQKKVTETAQTDGSGVTPNSVVGSQIALVSKQTAGFDRDAEQKAAKIYVDTWNTRRATDETGTSANIDNGLRDVDIGTIMTQLRDGLGA
jgi:hypothetical protein